MSQLHRDAFYDDTYDLGLRDADADQRRAREYARHIEAFLAQHFDRPPRGMTIVEFGCGTGALLNCLVDQGIAVRGLGIEPAAKLAEAARTCAGRNIVIREGFAENGVVIGGSHDLCVSVNVIEHALDPVSFLAACRASITEEGMIVTICPDGDHPNSELLFQDHVSSFSTTALALVATRAELRLVASAPLTGQQSGFRIFLLQRGQGAVAEPRRSQEQLSRLRSGYLGGWGELEQAVLSVLGRREFGIFGAGEYADLLHAYCPEIIDQAKFFIVDTPVQREKNGRVVITVDEFLAQNSMAALAAVHPRNWSMLKQRFSAISDRFLHPYQFCNLRSQL
ncbi:class I SAM-dependent methyltransferase [Mesorhizobium sp. A623]